MSNEVRTIRFDHDGHRFAARESVSDGGSQPQVKWTVEMDGREVLEFQGAYPYRDADVQRRVVEWYAIQKQR